MELGVCFIPQALSTSGEIARLAEDSGFGWFGVCDSPQLYADPHATMQAVMRETSSMRVGTFVTNPVTRHWSVQAAGFRALEEIGPGRMFMGIAPGDSAVYSVGLRPATLAALEDYVGNVRANVPSGLDTMVAAGGPKSVVRAARYADQIVIGQGASREALATLDALAASAERPADAPPLERWLFMLLHLAEEQSGVDAARDDLRAPLVAYSRQAFDFTFEGKGVPEHLRPKLRDLYDEYVFSEHSKTGDSANARALSAADRADVEEFLFERFAIVGTPEMAADQIERVVDGLHVDRLFLSVIASDPARLMRLAAERLMPRLSRLLHVTA